MQFLKQSTAITLKIGPFLDETDGKTAETGLTIAQADVRLSKNGGNLAQKNEGTSCTHDELGIYGCPIDTTDTNTLGRLQLWVHESGALPVWHEFMVVPANVWDSFFGADKLQVDATQVEGADATDTIQSSAAAALTAYDPPTKAEMDTAHALLATAAALTTVDTVADAIKAVTDNLPNSGSLSDLASILTDTGTTLPATLATIAAYIDSEVAAILAAVDTEVAAIKAVTDVLPDAGALNDLAAILTDTDTTLPATLATIEAYINTEVASILAAVDTEVAAIKAVTDSLTNLATLVDAVWDEDVDTSHQGAGTAGKKLDDAGGAADPWATALPGGYGAGTAGKIIGDNVNAPIATVDTVADAIKAVTDNLPNGGALSDLASILTDTGTTLPATLATIAAYIDSEVAAIKAVTDLLPDAGALNDLATILADTNELQTDWANGGRLDLLLDAVKAKTDSQPAGIPKGVEFTLVFLMKLSSDHVTPATGKSLTVQISKDGGAFAGATNAASEIAGGFYKVVLTAAEMTAAIIAVKATATACDQTSASITTSA